MMHRLIAPIFAATLALPAAAMDLTELTDAERAQFRAEVRAYLLDNPEVIMEAVTLLQTREAEAQARADDNLVSDNADAIFDDGYSWVGGNPDGDITLVEFLDYRCGYCKRAHGEVAKLLETDGNIRLIVKELPILGDQSVLASRFAIATKQIAGDDSYKAVNDALMAYNGDVTLPALRRLGSTFGLDMEAVETRMDSDEVTMEIAQTRALAQQLNISGTPTFVMHDELLRGYLPFDQMMALVEEKRG
ncbi:thioredoxin domain-containing protein [Sulfitobacter mediterraneus]|uniref:DsbA family protein n=1 Tax=Sulfitobacter mediterraneus TaxID=83219 RepID=UPI001934938B|nr:DsbA family protein [Sulfitobacter mediterraneus]MBM1631866.1 thioredoxin domain-containing protein [Sulfitobacter mediterraneus]MBM1639681.1 thioredoxin domain-containing protein [Sulfitobacter mediterraneus]MBM1643730.1 thioredoxin domain-containing protein [Sulfitobacter mediterraneus]MBM1647776.1 thioredoxin domain-containing protein [Sulfitobacter mediterraneus]MBM1651821.1 thioredoxin domain-containing protein [Sulfitobacter mediterraneus]